MAGTKRLLDNGTWELCVSHGSDLRGKRKRKYKYVSASGPREADILLAEFVAECNRRGYSDGEKMLIRDYAELWKQDHVEEQLKNKTIFRYEDLLKRVVEYLGNLRLCDIVDNPTYLKEFYRMLQEDGVRKDKERIDGKLVLKKGGLSIKTIRHHHALLSSMFSSAVDWNLIRENPCARVKPPKEKRKDRKKKNLNFYTIEQSKLFLQELDKLNINELKYKTIIYVAICTGLRRGEIMGLEWSDIDFKNNCISVERASLYTPKDGTFEDDTKTTSSERTVYVPAFLIDLLKEYKTWWDGEKNKAKDKWIASTRLFVQWNGKPMHPDTISQWFPDFIRKTELPHVTFHGLRHTYGSILLAMGMDLESVAGILGHENIQMLIQTYGHDVTKEANKKAADLIDAAILQPEQKPKEQEEVSSLPKSLPEDIRLLIEKLIITYAPPTNI